MDIRHIYSIYPIFPLWSISAIRIDFLAWFIYWVLFTYVNTYKSFCSLYNVFFFLGGGVWEKLVLQLLLSYCGLNHPLPSYLSRPQIVRFPVLPSSASSSCSFSIMQSKLRIEQIKTDEMPQAGELRLGTQVQRSYYHSCFGWTDP